MKKLKGKKAAMLQYEGGNSVIVKETVADDNLGNSRPVNDKPPGEVEITCSTNMLQVKQRRYSKWVHWASERLKDKMNKQGRIDQLGQGVSFSSEVMKLKEEENIGMTCPERN